MAVNLQKVMFILPCVFFFFFFLTLVTLDLSLSLSIKSVYPAEILLQLSGFWETVKWREIK